VASHIHQYDAIDLITARRGYDWTDSLTRPWTVIKSSRREADSRPYWREVNCSENNNHVEIGKEAYMLSAEGYLMPTKKDQRAPDLKYFKQTQR
jgi:hypothetical protein